MNFAWKMEAEETNIGREEVKENLETISQMYSFSEIKQPIVNLLLLSFIVFVYTFSFTY